MRIHLVRNIDERINHKSFYIFRPQLTLEILSIDQLIQQQKKHKYMSRQNKSKHFPHIGYCKPFSNIACKVKHIKVTSTYDKIDSQLKILIRYLNALISFCKLNNESHLIATF